MLARLCLALALLATADASLNNQLVKSSLKQSGGAVFKPMFVLIGDSITEYGFDAPHGWALQLASKYSRRSDVINRGFGGAAWSGVLVVGLAGVLVAAPCV